MPLFYVIMLAVIQGITEFLPVSSSGHLVLFHGIVDGAQTIEGKEINLLLDIAVHVGTLIAVCVYFWRDIWMMLIGGFNLIGGRIEHEGAKLNIYILVSSAPVIVAGFLLHAINPLWMREIWVVASTTIIFGAFLWYADDKGEDIASRAKEDMTIKDALIIGFAQVLALIPGTSRSGVTMTASRLLGFSRIEAARYSLLLSTVAISGAGALGAMDVVEIATPELAMSVLIGIAASFVAALIAISLMMRWLATQTFRVFAIYRFILGGVLLAALAAGWI